jgi:hypothetical protein
LTSPPDKLPSKSPESAIGKFHQTSDGTKGVVQKALHRNADEVVVESTRVDGTKLGVTPRARIENTARVYLCGIP